MPRSHGRTGRTGKRAAEPSGSALYEVLKGIDFEHRELVGKSKGVGLFDLVKEKFFMMAAAIGGRLDGIVLTGGLAYSDPFCAMVEEKTSFLGKVFRFPGEFEMEALALGALRVLNNEEKAIDYGSIK